MIDRRAKLNNGAILDFPGMKCRIDGFVGCGSNALVYRGSFSDSLNRESSHYVLIKELFPLTPNGEIFRSDDGNIVVSPEGAAVWEMQLDSFVRGNRMHLELLKRHPEMIGGNINTYEANGTRYTLLNLSGGTDLNAELTAHFSSLTLKNAARRMMGVLEALSVFHEAGYLHLDIAPDNILIVPRAGHEDVFLIDYNSVYNANDRRSDGSLITSIKQGYTAPEIVNEKRQDVGYETDLYSVAAVFFRMLKGRALSPEELISPKAPNISNSRLLADVPDMVLSMVKHIIKKGLATLSRHRYHNIAEMRADFEELIDRIDCVGVTRWAIQEKQRAALEKYILDNPSAGFLKDAQACFPLRVSINGNEVPAGELYNVCSSEGARLTLLSAAGGMGKTTALRLMLMSLNQRYQARKPVGVYISAADYTKEQTDFLHDSILKQLKFNLETNTYLEARHKLDELMRTPLEGGEAALVILLDGMNEISCDNTGLLNEIQRLSACEGALIIMTSRSNVDIPGMRTAELMPLTQEDAETALKRKNLLVPENEELRQLITAPLMLSLFIRTAVESGTQVNAQSADELLTAFFETLASGQADAEADTLRREAAVKYVLPMIASAQMKQKRALTGKELLKIVKRCFNVLSAADMARVFPEWAGKRKAICGGEKYDDWYGVIVRELLVRRLGILTVDAAGNTRVFHDSICEWLGTKVPALRKRLLRRTRLRVCLAALIVLIVSVSGFFVWKSAVYRKPFERELIETVLSNGASPYTDMDEVALNVKNATAAAASGKYRESDYLRACENIKSAAVRNTRTAARARVYADTLDKRAADGAEIVADSGLEFDISAYRELIDYPGSRIDYYLEWLSVLDRFMQNPINSSLSSEFTQMKDELPYLIDKVLERDMQVMADLYYIAIDRQLMNGPGILDAPAFEAYKQCLTDSNAGMWEALKVSRVIKDNELYDRLKADKEALEDAQTELENRNYKRILEYAGGTQ